jgi:hypothetical protein
MVGSQAGIASLEGRAQGAQNGPPTGISIREESMGGLKRS